MKIDKDEITITKKRMKELLEAELKLNLLEAGGVDNWVNYDNALENYDNALENI